MFNLLRILNQNSQCEKPVKGQPEKSSLYRLRRGSDWAVAHISDSYNLYCKLSYLSVVNVKTAAFVVFLAVDTDLFYRLLHEYGLAGTWEKYEEKQKLYNLILISAAPHIDKCFCKEEAERYTFKRE